MPEGATCLSNVVFTTKRYNDVTLVDIIIKFGLHMLFYQRKVE